MMDKVVKESGQRKRAVKVRGLTCIGGWYYFRPAQREGVRPPRVALGTENWDEAVRQAIELGKNRASRFVPGTWVFETTKFLDERRARKMSRWTVENDECVLRLFGEQIGKEMLCSVVTQGRIEKWVGKLRASGKGGPTVKTYLLRLNAFFVWLMKRGGVQRNPVAGIDVPVVRKTRAERFLTKGQRDGLIGLCRHGRQQEGVARVMGHLTGTGAYRLKPRADVLMMLMLGFHAGLRLREMLEARREWLRFWPGGGGEICVMETATFVPKDKEARRIPMNERLHAFLAAQHFEGAFLVRPDVGHAQHKYRWEPRKPFSRLLKEAGLEWVGWHTLRHTFATLLVMGGCPIATVAQWLGDGIEVTFKNYVGYAPVPAHVNASL